MVSSLALSTITTLHAQFNVLALERYSKELAAADATNWFHGWRELGVELKKYQGKELAITPSHQLSAQIMYYTDAAIVAHTARMTCPSQFNLWESPSEADRANGLYVWTDADFIGPNGTHFASPSQSHALHVYRDGRPVRTYYIMQGQQGSAPPFPGG